MKVNYDRSEDILMIEISEDKIDYAEKAGTIIVHFTEAGKPVLLEILNASEFLSSVVKTAIRSEEELSEVA